MSASEIVSFRDLDAWRVAMHLAEEVYGLSTRLPANERFELSAQLRRSAVSIPSNIAEGQSCGMPGRYMTHLAIAKGSLGELETEIELARRLGMLSASDTGNVETLLRRAGQLLHGLTRSVRKLRLGSENRV